MNEIFIAHVVTSKASPERSIVVKASLNGHTGKPRTLGHAGAVYVLSWLI